MPKVIVHLRIASTYFFCVTVFGVIFLPRCDQSTSSKISRTSSDSSIAFSTVSTVPAPISCPLSTRSTSSSTTARAAATLSSSPSSVSRLPRRLIWQPSRSRSAPSTPSPIPASSAATSFGTSRTACTRPLCQRGLHGLAQAHGLDGEVSAGSVVADVGVVAQALEQPQLERRCERKRQRGDGQRDRGAPEPLSHLVDEIAVAHLVGAADLVHGLAREREPHRGDRVLDEVLEGDRLREVVEPVRADQDGQLL